MNRAPPTVAVMADAVEQADAARALAHDLDLPFIESGAQEFDYFLAITAERIELRPNLKKASPVFVDFAAGTIDFRRRYGQKGGEAIIRAIGGAGRKVFDATAGLASDTFILASHECEVTAIEREPVIAVLVKDALRRGLADADIKKVCSRIHFRLGDAAKILSAAKPGVFDVVYLDPMFPEKKKTALPKKSLRVLQDFAGGPENELESQALLELARLRAARVVVKRPARAPALGAGVKHSIKQASVRFDVYVG